MEQSEKILLEFAGYCYIHKPELANDLNTLIADFINKPKEQLSIPRVSNSKRVKILDQGNGDCGIICDEVLEHYKKMNYLEEGDKLYKCELIKTY